jgi:hypothetical protein
VISSAWHEICASVYGQARCGCGTVLVVVVVVVLLVTGVAVSISVDITSTVEMLVVIVWRSCDSSRSRSSRCSRSISADGVGCCGGGHVRGRSSS